MPPAGVPLLMACAFALSLGCTPAPDRFQSRVAFFRDFSHSLPSCAAGDTAPSAAELLANELAPGDRASVRGHPSLICLQLERALAGMNRRSEKAAEPGYCEGYPTMWLLWGTTRPAPRYLRSAGPACVELSPKGVRDAVILHPIPFALLDCDAEAVERAVPELTVIASGVVLDTPGEALSAESRIDLDVERICRIDSPAPAAR